MSSRLLPGIAIGAAVTAMVIAALVWFQAPGLTPAAPCSGATCQITVKVKEGLFPGWGACNVEVSSEVEMPMGIDPVEWTIVTPGYSFVSGGHGVTILNNADDFSPGTSSPTVFKLSRSSTAPRKRVYKYNLNIERDSDQAFCRVPTLPRIKNE